MPLLVRIIGIVVMVAGVWFLVKPGLIRPIFAYFCQGKRVYLAGVIRIGLGVVFLLAASQCRLPWLIIILGIFFLIAGILIFPLGADRCRNIMNIFQGKPDNLLRLITLIPVALGIIIIFAS